MKNALAFFGFIAVLGLLVALNLAGFWGIIFLLTFLIIATAVAAAIFPQVSSALGFVGASIGASNNSRLLALFFLTLFFFVLAFKYGAGEPLFLSTWKEVAFRAKNSYNEDRQKTVNEALLGLNESNREIENKRKFLQSAREKYPPLTEEEIKEKVKDKDVSFYRKEYRECLSNYSKYGVFANNSEIRALLKRYTSEERVKEQTEKPKEGKSWVFWKLAFLFLFLTILYIPFAFADEISEALEKIIERIKDFHDEIKTQTVPTSSTSDAAPATQAISKTGLLTRLYASDIAAGFTVRLIQGIIGAIRRK